jgi:hypothetical protein
MNVFVLHKNNSISTLLANEENFLSIQNENGEYVFNPPIHYNCFMPILCSITLEQPHILFHELPEDETIVV